MKGFLKWQSPLTMRNNFTVPVLFALDEFYDLFQSQFILLYIHINDFSNKS